MSTELFEVGELKGFSPTKGLLKKMLAVRVSPPSTSVSHPGLLSISDYDSDMKKAMIGLFSELCGLALLYYYAVIIRRLPWFWVLIGALVLFILDFVLMLFHHRFDVAKNTLLKFENALFKASSDESEKLRYKQNQDQIQRNEKKALFFEALLWMAAVAKIIGVFYIVPIGRNGELPYGILIMLMLAYFGAAFMHIKASGYALSGYSATKEFNKELSKYANTQTLPANALQKDDSLPLPEQAIFAKPEVQSLVPNSHKIGLNPLHGNAGQALYNLERLGILSDKQISEWESKTKDREGAGAALTRTAMRLQLRMFTGVPI